MLPGVLSHVLKYVFHLLTLEATIPFFLRNEIAVFKPINVITVSAFHSWRVESTFEASWPPRHPHSFISDLTSADLFNYPA